MKKPRLTQLLAILIAVITILFAIKFRSRDGAAATDSGSKQVQTKRSVSGTDNPEVARPLGRRHPRPEREESGDKAIGAAELKKWLAGLKGDRRTIAEAYATVGLLNNDPELIRKALEMDPNNPHLIYIGVTAGDFSDEERQALAERFFKEDPDNALAAYLYAARLFESGDPEKGLEILGSAMARERMDDYNARMGIMFEEAWAGAGMSRHLAKLQSIYAIGIPYLPDLESFTDSLDHSANAAAPADAAKINALSAAMGKRMGEQTASGGIMTHLSGLRLEEKTLAGLPADSPSPYEGLTVEEARESIAIELENLTESLKDLPVLGDLLPGNAELTSGFVDQFRQHGEAAAYKWLQQQTAGAE